jgi:hypothetical protein
MKFFNYCYKEEINTHFGEHFEDTCILQVQDGDDCTDGGFEMIRTTWEDNRKESFIEEIEQLLHIFLRECLRPFVV